MDDLQTIAHYVSCTRRDDGKDVARCRMGVKLYDFPLLRARLVQALAAVGQHDEAMAIVTALKARQLSDTELAQVLHAEGNALAGRKQFHAALEPLTRLLQIAPESIPDHLLRVLIGALLGALFGVVFGSEGILFSLTNNDLGQIGLLVIRLLKALAVPLILFAILDALMRTRISARKGGKLVAICLVNVSVAFVIGLTLMNVLRPGEQWRGKLEQITGAIQHESRGLTSKAPAPSTPAAATLNPLKNLAGYIPESLVEPFLKNNLITVILGGLLFGVALRRVKQRQSSAGLAAFAAMEGCITAIYQSLMQSWSGSFRQYPSRFSEWCVGG